MRDSHPRKLYPAYGKDLAMARQRGLVPKLPGGYLGVFIGWDLHRLDWDGNPIPHVVVPTDRKMTEFNLSFLAGLPVQLFYERHHWRLAHVLLGELLAAHPRFLGSWCLMPDGALHYPRCHYHQNERLPGLTDVFQPLPVFSD